MSTQVEVRISSGLAQAFVADLERIRDRLPELAYCRAAHEEIKTRLRQSVALGQDFYESEAVNFNKAYFAKNYLKALLAVSYFRCRGLFADSAGLIDLGAGAGPATIAAVRAGLSSERVMIDSSHSQSDISSQLCTALSISSRPIRGDALQVIQAFPNATKLVSYWLCEQSSTGAELIRNVAGRSALFIDYPRYLDRVREALSHSHVIYSIDHRFHLPSALQRELNAKSIRVHSVAAVQRNAA